MNKNELMIGNILTDNNGRILTVNDIKQSGVRCLYKGQQNTETEGVRNSLFSYEDVHGMEISNNLLLTLGFEPALGAEPAYSLDVKIGMTTDFTLVLKDGKYIYHCSNGRTIPLCRHFKYLHDLQNFFSVFWEVTLNIRSVV